jgi:type VI secretion system secreted protein VgrG
MPNNVQANFPMFAKTPLGDKLLLTGFSGQEGISQLFRFQLDLVAAKSLTVPFDQVLGAAITVNTPIGPGKIRHINGICSTFSQGEVGEEFTRYRAEIVPKLWTLTRSAHSRIFQSLSVPDILKKVLKDIDPTYTLKGTFHPRDYCVQYRETDFNFACRIMEEEGIFYFFTHKDGEHKMVVANDISHHPDLPQGKNLLYADAPSGDSGSNSIYDWEKSQELRSGKIRLWDECFEKPHDHFEATKEIADAVPVGGVSHKLKVGGNDKLEIYDFPGEYAQRFDGVQPGGGDRAADVGKIKDDGARTAAIRMEEETAQGIVINGASRCPQLTPGHKFTFTRLPDDKDAELMKAEGAYVVTRVMHAGQSADYRSGGGGGASYHNSFTCIPAALPFRPPRLTPKPMIPGTQTATVVGSGAAGEEILTDKYGRVKVQFHWDRAGPHNASEEQGKLKYSSCWVRVAQIWAGKRWGASFWPRIGQEVVVGFIEGDMDMPIIIGSVYNAEQMPPYLGEGLDSKHKNDNKVSGVKSNTTQGGKGFNEWRFDDTKDKEQIFIHAQRNMDTRVRNESMERVISNRHLIVGWKNGEEEGEGQQGGDQRELVNQDKHLNVKRHHVEKVEGNLNLTVGKGDEPSGGNVEILIEKDKKELIEKNSHLHIKENRKELVDMNQHLTVGMDMHEKIGMNYAIEAGMAIHIKAGMTLVLEAGMQISLKVGGNFVDINPTGVAINGMPAVLINSGGAAGSGSGAKPEKPEDAKEAKPTKPKVADDSKSGLKSAP